MPNETPLTPMNDEQYSMFWEQESLLFENQGIYGKLIETIPDGSVVEVGCGAGLATHHLVTHRQVLAIDNNAHLLAKAKGRTIASGANVRFLEADLLDLSRRDIESIKEFAPRGIICWFIGSNPANVNQHTQGLQLNEQGKKYREEVEDLVVSRKLCSDSVEWIHLVNRAGIIDTATQEEIFRAQRDDYNTHVFNSAGFEVVDVRTFVWNRDGSNFMYAFAPNPNLQSGRPINAIVSVLARRRAGSTK